MGIDDGSELGEFGDPLTEHDGGEVCEGIDTGELAVDLPGGEFLTTETVDSDSDGVVDTAVVVDGEGDTTLFTDCDGDGTADLATTIEPDGRAETLRRTGEHGWVAMDGESWRAFVQPPGNGIGGSGSVSGTSGASDVSEAPDVVGGRDVFAPSVVRIDETTGQWISFN